MQTIMLCRQHIKYNRRIRDQHESDIQNALTEQLLGLRHQYTEQIGSIR